MTWTINATGSENSTAAAEVTADGTNNDLTQKQKFEASNGDILFYTARVFIPSGYNGDIAVGVEQVDSSLAGATDVLTTINNISLTLNSWQTLRGNVTVTKTDTAYVAPMFRVPSNATTGTVKVSKFKMSQNPASTEETDNVLNERVPVDSNIIIDPFFFRANDLVMNDWWSDADGWTTTSAGSENSTPTLQVTPSLTERDTYQIQPVPATAFDTFYYEMRAKFDSQWNGDFYLGYRALNSDKAFLSSATITITEAAIDKGNWATYSGTWAVSGLGIAYIQPLFRTDAATGIGKTLDIAYYTVSRNEPGSTLGGQLGTNIKEEGGTSVGDLNALNRFNAIDNMIADPYFAESQSVAWDLGNGDFSRTLNGEIAGTPCLEATFTTTDTFQFFQATDTDLLSPATAGETLYLTARVNTTVEPISGSRSITAFSDSGGGIVRATLSSYSVYLSTDRWVTISGTTNYNGTYLVVDHDALAAWFEFEATWVANDATGTATGYSLPGWRVRRYDQDLTLIGTSTFTLCESQQLPVNTWGYATSYVLLPNDKTHYVSIGTDIGGVSGTIKYQSIYASKFIQPGIAPLKLSSGIADTNTYQSLYWPGSMAAGISNRLVGFNLLENEEGIEVQGNLELWYCDNMKLVSGAISVYGGGGGIYGTGGHIRLFGGLESASSPTYMCLGYDSASTFHIDVDSSDFLEFQFDGTSEMYLKSSGAVGDWGIFYNNAGGVIGTSSLYIKFDGTTGIDFYASASDRMQISSDIKILTDVTVNTGNSHTLGVSTSLDFNNVYSRNGVTTGSDRRMKFDIADLDINKIAEFMNAITAVSFRHIDDGEDGLLSYGFIAQDVVEKLDDIGVNYRDTKLVSEEDTDEGILGLKYMMFVPLLTATIQKQQDEIDDLKSEMEELRAMVADLQVKNEKINVLEERLAKLEELYAS